MSQPADNPIHVRDAQDDDVVIVATLPIDSRDGAAVLNERVQVLVIGEVDDDGNLVRTTPANPPKHVDASPPEKVIFRGGIDVGPAGATIAVTPGRIKIDLVRLDSVDGGATPVAVSGGAFDAVADEGGGLWPRGGVSFYTDEPIKLLYPGAGTARIGFIEWSAG